MAKTHNTSARRTANIDCSHSEHALLYHKKDNSRQWLGNKVIALTYSQLTHLLILTVLAVLLQMPGSSIAAPLAGAPTDASAMAAHTGKDTFGMAHALHKLAPHGSSHSRHKRLHKRHHDYALKRIAASNTSQVEWQNACNGNYKGKSARASNVQPKHKHETMKNLTKAFRLMVRSENETQMYTTHHIRIDDMKTWRRHAPKYKFLPQLKRNSTFKPFDWHRDLQKYVASFAYLGRIQYLWDENKLQAISKTSHELNQLLLSAKSVLCGLEETINASLPHSRRKFYIITQEEMDQTLRFYSNDPNRVEAQGAVSTDLKFTKKRYYSFLARMVKILAVALRMQNGELMDLTSTESEDISKNSADVSASLNAESA